MIGAGLINTIVEKLGFNSFVMKVYQATASAPVNIACIK